MNNNSKILEIKKLIRDIGVPVNLRGYKYITEAVIIMLNSEKNIFLTEIYENISKIYNVSIESVEISIRHAIKKSIENNSKIKKIMCIPENKSVSNSIFLNNIKELTLEKNIFN